MDRDYGGLCLCCGKPVEGGLWHKSCIKGFFGAVELPSIKLDSDNLETLAATQLGEGKTVAGVQEKLSLHLDLSNRHRPRLTLLGLPSGYILKPQSSNYKRLPEFEHTAMLLASLCGLPVVKHGLIPLEGGELAYITKRIDRDEKGKIHMEDFCQASNNLTIDKYRYSYEGCVELIMRYSANPIIDKIRFFSCLYFSFLIGNSDAHLKNFSFLMDGEGKLSLSPFYDLLPTRIILPSDKEDLGMVFNGRKSKLRGHDFEQFASNTNIAKLTKEKIMRGIEAKYDSMCEVIDAALLDQNSKSEWKRMIRANIKRAHKP